MAEEYSSGWDRLFSQTQSIYTEEDSHLQIFINFSLCSSQIFHIL